MALSHVASSAWVAGTAAVTPLLPTGTLAGHYVVIFLASKYDDAQLGTQAADLVAAGWTDLGTAVNTGRSTGNDNGNLRGRAFGKVWATGDSMPALNPTPNNVSVTKATTYSVSAGSGFSVSAEMVKDDTVGTPLLLAAVSTLGLASGDILHTDFALNSDVATFGTTTTTATGATLGAASTNTADGSTASGTDMRYRSLRYAVTAGTATGNPTVSTALAGTTTNSVGVGLILRIREVLPPNAPTAFTTVLNANNIGCSWTSPGSGPAPDAYKLYRTLTVYNEDFSSGVVSWTGTTATVALVTGRLRVTYTSTASGIALSAPILVSPGQVLSLSGTAFQVTGSRTSVVGITMYTNAGGTAGANTAMSSSGTPAGGGTVFGSAGFVVPEGYASVRVRVGTTTTGAANDSQDFDDLSLSITSLITTVSAPTTSYSDTTAAPGKTYTYYVKASASGVESSASNTDSETTGTFTLSATPDADSIQLSWNNPIGTSPSSYKIYRKHNANLLTGDSSTFDSSVGSWTSSGANAVVSHQGDRLRVTHNTTGAASITADAIPMSAGAQVFISAKARSEVGSRPVAVGFVFYSDLAGTANGITDYSVDATPTGSYGVFTHSAVVPVGSVSFRPRLVDRMSATSTDVMEWDDVVVTSPSLISTVSAPTISYDDTSIVIGTVYDYYIKPVIGGVEQEASNVETVSVVETNPGWPDVLLNSVWTAKPAMIHNGTTWVEKPMLRHNGTEWIPV